MNLAEGQRSSKIQAEFFSVAKTAHAVPDELHSALFAPLLEAAYRRCEMAVERGEAPMTHAEVDANLRCALHAGAATPRQVLSVGDLGAALGGSGLSTSTPPTQGDTPGHPEECGMRTCEECGTLYRYGQALRTGEWYLIPERSHSPLAKRLRRRGAGGLPLPRSDGEVILVNTPSEGGVLVPDPYSYVQVSLHQIPSHHKVRPIAVFPSAKRRTSGRCRGRYQPDVSAEVLYPRTMTPMREGGIREDKSISTPRPLTNPPPPAPLIVPRSTPGRRRDFRRGMPNPRKTPRQHPSTDELRAAPSEASAVEWASWDSTAPLGCQTKVSNQLPGGGEVDTEGREDDRHRAAAPSSLQGPESPPQAPLRAF